MGMYLHEYVTISVPRRVKEVLEKAKGKESWGDFLLRVYNEYKKMEKILAFNELRRSLSDEELDNILKSMREFRKGFRLR